MSIFSFHSLVCGNSVVVGAIDHDEGMALVESPKYPFEKELDAHGAPLDFDTALKLIEQCYS